MKPVMIGLIIAMVFLNGAIWPPIIKGRLRRGDHTSDKAGENMETMYFKNSCFNDYSTSRNKLNYTVRLGDKWGKLLTVGDTFNIALASGDKAVIAKAQVADVIITRIGYIKRLHPCVYDYEHDPQCRDLHGLLWTLEDAYQDEFKGKSGSEQYNQIVTCIGFWLIERVTDGKEKENG